VLRTFRYASPAAASKLLLGPFCADYKHGEVIPRCVRVRFTEQLWVPAGEMSLTAFATVVSPCHNVETVGCVNNVARLKCTILFKHVRRSTLRTVEFRNEKMWEPEEYTRSVV